MNSRSLGSQNSYAKTLSFRQEKPLVFGFFDSVPCLNFGGIPLHKWLNPDADLTGVVSATIKNAQGKPAELCWWYPKQAPIAFIKAPDGTETTSRWGLYVDDS